MSLVGPRPPLQHEVAQYDDAMARRLRVRPGMTGLWQVSGRSDLSWSEAIRLDLYYVDNWSMVQDLTILARTFGAVMGFPRGLLSRSLSLRDSSARPAARPRGGTRWTRSVRGRARCAPAAEPAACPRRTPPS